MCRKLLSVQSHYDFSLRAVKCVLNACHKLKLQSGTTNKCDDSFDAEAKIILRAIVDVHASKFTAKDAELFQGILSDCFPDLKPLAADRADLEAAVKREIEAKGLQCSPWYFKKVMQLYEILHVQHGVMLVGSPLGGKTSAYQVLATALTEVANNTESKLKEHKVVCKVINPKAITSGQLYGCFDPATYEWSDGILANTFREYASSSTPDRKWIVFDGPVDSSWVDNMNTTLDDNKKLCLMSGEIIKMSPCMTLVFECAELAQASPGVVSRCGVVLLDSRELGWRALAEAFSNGLLRARLTMDEQLELVRELMTWLVQPVLEYVDQLPSFLRTSHMHRFRCFSRLFLCLLGKDTQFPSLWLQGTLIFCLIWGICSTLTAEGRKTFDVFFRAMLNGENKAYPRPKVFKLTPQQLIPEKGLVFDWVHDKKNNGTWVTWLDTLDKNQVQTLVPTPELACQQFFLRTSLAQEGTPLLMIGPAGSGKTAVTLDYMRALPKEKYLANVINFSAKTSANHTQDMIMSRLDRRRKGVFGPPMGKQCILFVDDVSVPRPEAQGAQPAVELLRQWMDHGHWYDRDTSRLELVDILFIAAMSAGRGQQLSARFIRHMHVIAVDTISEISIEKIFTTQIIDWHFSKGFSSNVTRLGKSIVQASLDVYRTVLSRFLPTPECAHYVFCSRDLARLAQGVTSVPATHLTDADKLARLWMHEVYRVFYDRLSTDAHRNEFFQLIKKSCVKYFNKPMESILRRLLPEGETKLDENHLQGLIFGSFMEPDANPRIYDEIPDQGALLTKLQFYLREYNASSRSPLPLVLFEYAVQHACRLSRALHLPVAGHVLLVGVAGSGRRSIARMAATMAGQTVFEIEITKNYGFDNWRNDLKILLKRSGAENKPTMFLISDTQLNNDLFLKDLNLIFCSGDIPTLFSLEEKTDILEKMLVVAKDMGRKVEASPLALYNYFIERIRANLHVMLALSPIGRDFRDRFQRFPSLLSCCLIDWFTTWPEKGLEKVADHFLSQMELEEEVRDKCIAMCKYFHTSATERSLRFEREVKRYNYITPASYLELIHTFEKLFVSKTEAIRAYKNRYILGLQQLDFAANQVEVMQEQLKTLRPQLMETSEETDKLMIKIEQDTVEVEAKKEIVGSDESKANEAAAAAQAIKDDCEGDLAEAIPALESAVNALNTLKPADITVVKAMKNPPPGVKLVMEAICVMKGVKPDRKPDPSGSGKMLEDFWGPSLKLLGDIKFLDSLKSYNKDNISPTIMKRIREKYIHDREFHPESVRKTSTACEGLCKWVRAIEVYDRVIKIVAPKKAKLAEAEAELAVQMGTLNEKREQLQQVTDKLQTLNDDFAAMSKKKKDLEDNIDLCSQKLERAEKLIGGLGGEKNRWDDMAAQLENKLSNVTGDILLASGMVTYLGAFNADFRQECIEDWTRKCKELQISCTEPFSLLTALGDAMQMRNWNIAGLPADPFSLESGIIVKNCRRWPLMIDPQGQASKWIKNLELSNNLVVTKMTNRDYILALEKAIENGYPLLIENIGEELDPILDPILLKKTYINGEGKKKIKFGDFVIDYNDNFQLYLTTTLSNPHYLPDTAVKVTLMNFVLRPAGLEERLLALVVAREEPHLEDSKGALILEGAKSRQQLQDIEDKILEVLSSSESNILEDETGIQILSTSKALSEEISSKQEISSQKEAEIDQARFQYMPVARYASVLFFCIAELSVLQPTYQYSLAWYTALYIQAIDNSEPSESIDKRIKMLNKHITHIIYENICRSLFEKDKIVFSFLLWIAILRSEGKLDADVWKFIVGSSNAYSGDNGKIKNPDPNWISDGTWNQILVASNLPNLKGIDEAVASNLQMWKQFVRSKTPHKMEIPAPFQHLTGLDKIAVLKCLRPDKLLSAAYEVIGNELGKEYVDSPSFDLQKSFNVSSACVPLILVLFPGSDPTEMILQFAEDCKVPTPHIISLGQEQGSAAENAIIEGACKGGWVILQNCHLFESWMSELERICDITTKDQTHKNFRLWLITGPTNSIPVSILERGVKMTTETPQDFKSKVQHCYKIIPSYPVYMERAATQVELHKLTFSLSLFHAVVLGRRLFGPMGWNKEYEFNDDDYKMSVMQLQVFLDEYKDHIPYNGLTYMIAKCFYGGRMSDKHDRKLLKSLLSLFSNSDVVERARIVEHFDIPEFSNLYDYLTNLSLEDATEIYGLNQNSSILKGLKDTKKMLSSVMCIQPATMPAMKTDQEISVSAIIAKILDTVPLPFDTNDARRRRPVREDFKNIVLHQELEMYNDLLSTLHSSLKELALALEGHAAMTERLEEMHHCLSIDKIPPQWAKKSYPTLKYLDKYLQDLLHRVEFFQSWIKNGVPKSFWISAFFCPKSMLTSTIQNFSRQSKIAIENVSLNFSITQHEVPNMKNIELHLTPHQILIHGLSLEGAQWSRENQMLTQVENGVLSDLLPAVLVEPVSKEEINQGVYFRCPVYQTSTRGDNLLVTHISLPTTQSPQSWLKQGVACLCQADSIY
ncbi:hypothetical protein B566_EDAN014797 [Ephemera danica]|nr:hypothetical protein B566_EDAN014797 [Ephemera danica]